MENVVVPFFFIFLPIAVQQRITRNMDCLPQLIFSILSKRTKSLLKSLKVKASFVTLKLGIFVTIELHFSDYSRLRVLLRDEQERVLDDVLLLFISQQQNQRARIKWNFVFRKWLLHVLDIYYVIQIQEMEFLHNSSIYNLGSIKAALKGVETTTLVIRLNDEMLFKDITNLFLQAKRLMINDYQVVDNDYLQHVLQSNFDFFEVATDRNRYYASLDRFLTMNAFSSNIRHSLMTDRALNKFFKLWMKGAMPRLQRLSMSFSLVLKRNVILNGVGYSERREGEETSGLFEERNGPEPLTVQGGLSIMRSDGTEATIKMIGEEDNVIGFNFYVWSQ